MQKTNHGGRNRDTGHHGEPGQRSEQASEHHAAHDHGRHHHHHDHNLRSAYLHVIADAFTSLLAIFALLAGKYFNAIWLDPTMGIVGALLVERWAVGLLRTTARVLLDWQTPNDLCAIIRHELLADGDTEVVDLHVWAIGPGRHAAAISVACAAARRPDEYKARLKHACVGLVHVTIEVNDPPEADPQDAESCTD